MQDDEERVEGVEMHVEGVAPLHIIVLRGVFQQVLVGDDPGSTKQTSTTLPTLTETLRKMTQFPLPALTWSIKVFSPRYLPRILTHQLPKFSGTLTT